MATADEELHDALTRELDEKVDQVRYWDAGQDEGPEPAPFRLEDIGAANWAARKLRKALTKLADIHGEAEAERARIDEWEAAATRQPSQDAEYFEGLLRDYAMRVFEETGDKSVRLIGGSVKSRATTNWAIDDNIFLAWANGTGDSSLIRIKQSPDREAMKKALTVHKFGDEFSAHRLVTEDGEIVPGAVVYKGRSYSVDIKVDPKGGKS